jgi:hypothetical protein
MAMNSPDSNLSNKKFTPTNQTPSTNKLNLQYQVGATRSPIPENTNSSSNLNKQQTTSNSNKYSFLNAGANTRQGGFKMNKDVNM